MTSLFTASYVMSWRDYLPETPLRYAPSFDGRIVLYPGVREIRDYFAWRQADSAHPSFVYMSTETADVPSAHSAHKQPLQHRILGSRPAGPT